LPPVLMHWIPAITWQVLAVRGCLDAV
jgi:hypothetical protein